MKDLSQKSDFIVDGVVEYLKENNQEYLLPEVTSKLEKETQKEGNIENIIVTSMIPLTSVQLERLKVSVSKMLGLKNLPIKNKIDKNLIGGLTVRAGDWFLDASLRRDLNNLKRMLTS